MNSQCQEAVQGYIIASDTASFIAHKFTHFSGNYHRPNLNFTLHTHTFYALPPCDTKHKAGPA